MRSRSNLFLIDYDQNKKIWDSRLPFFTAQVEDKIPKLRKTIEQWKKKYFIRLLTLSI